MDNQSQASLSYQLEGEKIALTLAGSWGLENIAALDSKMRPLERGSYSMVTICCAAINYLDTAGAWLLVRFMAEQRKAGALLELQNFNQKWQPLLDIVAANFPIADRSTAETPSLVKESLFNGFLRYIGKLYIKSQKDITASLYILGLAVADFNNKAQKGREFGLASIILQLQKIGLNAVMIIAVMALIVGAILTQQGAFQLRKFGAELYVIDMISLLSLREIGVLITAILIAGRSGSAITAELGAMKMREEIDALKVMGLNPIKILIFPRLLALMIALPLLTIIADIFSLLGSALVSYFYSDIRYSLFLERLTTETNSTSYILGLVKAPFMALIIGFISAIEGFKVKGSTESLGQKVTSSVVKSIFSVILLNAIFALIYVILGY